MAIILDIANYRLFKSVRSDAPVDPTKNFMKIEFMNKAIDAIIFPVILRSESVAKEFQSTSEIRNHQLYQMNILTLLPANYSTLHQPFQTWTLRITSQVHIVANVKPQSFAVNPMAM